MRLALPKLYSFEYKAKTTMAAYSQRIQSKKIKISQKSTILRITKILSFWNKPLYLTMVIAIFLLGH
jgi:hypothetical protein